MRLKSGLSGGYNPIIISTILLTIAKGIIKHESRLMFFCKLHPEHKTL